MADNKIVKISVNLPESTLEELRRIADQRGVTLTQAIKDAIALEQLVTREVTGDARLIIEKPSENTRERVLLTR